MACPPGKKCGQELALITTLDDCPSDDEKVLFSGAEGGEGTYKYANRTWATIKACLGGGGGGSNLFAFLQLEVPTDIAEGETIVTVDLGTAVPTQDSVWISLDGTELARNKADRISYTVVYSATSFDITFIQGVISSQLYIIHYAYTQAV